MGDRLTPLFLLFTPRSGSTLLQRMLATHPKIATVSEPWILLPFLYTMRRNGVRAEYSHRMLTKALDDFVEQLPGGWDTYRSELREFAVRLYEDATGADTVYFLDKSPRYGLVVEELLATFPDAKFIQLWRHPLAVVSSTIETWGDGRWKLEPHRVDLFTGLTEMVDACRRHPERFHTIRYESLLSSPHETLSAVFDHLGLEDWPEAAEEFVDVHLEGERGDPTGVQEYSSLSNAPLAKWQQTLNNPFRKRWCRRYLNSIGRDRLETMGYDLDQMIEELDGVPTTWRRTASDVMLSASGFLQSLFEVDLLRTKLMKARRGFSVHRHR